MNGIRISVKDMVVKKLLCCGQDLHLSSLLTNHVLFPDKQNKNERTSLFICYMGSLNKYDAFQS